jgi:transcriptional regulator with XRE-family HTH domain
MSQQDLAAAANLHFTAISRVEQATREPRLSTIFAIADALEVAPAELFAGISRSR